MTQGHFAASILRLFAWLFLVGSVAWALYSTIQTALALRDSTSGNTLIGLGLTLIIIIAVGSMAGGAFMWALLVGLASLIETSIERTELMRTQVYGEQAPDNQIGRVRHVR